MQAAEQYGCDYIATGHYAQIAQHRGHVYLRNAVDTHKDQTYFLWMLTAIVLIATDSTRFFSPLPSTALNKALYDFTSSTNYRAL